MRDRIERPGERNDGICGEGTDRQVGIVEDSVIASTHLPLPSVRTLNCEGIGASDADNARVEVINRHRCIGGIEQIHFKYWIHDACHLAIPIRLERLAQIKFHTKADEVASL